MIPIKIEGYEEMPTIDVSEVVKLIGSLSAMFLEVRHSNSSERLFRMTVSEDRTVRFDIGNNGGIANESKNASYKRSVRAVKK